MIRESKQFYFFYGLIILIYLLNIGGNAIWTTHEAYYAEAVREMLESGIWSEFFFNYEPRFQKPPLTYWLMAGSSSILGLSEFSLRIPMVICSILTVLLVYKLGKLLYDEKTGLLSMLIFAMSLQFIWFKSYASPEIPLAFLFTLSLYAYFKGLLTTNKSWFYYSWIALGLSALTKGFPYILLFFVIILIHRFFENKREAGYTIRPAKLLFGFIISSFIGLSWPIYMIITYGDLYTQMFLFETTARVTNHAVELGVLDSILFYPQTILWSFFPFSLLFYYSLVKMVQHQELRSTLSTPLIWFGVFLLVFTVSSGQLPSYILQAHPAMSLIAGFMIVHTLPQRRFEKLIWRICLWLPGVLILSATFIIISKIKLSLLYAALLIIGVAVTVYWTKNLPKLHRQVFVLWSLSAVLMVIVFLGLMPWTEQFRRYSGIQEVIKTEETDSKVPLYIEGRFLDNLPFYAERKVYGGIEWTKEKIESQEGIKLILHKRKIDSFTTFGMTSKNKILWEGPIHAKGPEDHFFKFIRDCYLYSKGDSSRFIDYRLFLIQD